MNGIHKYTWDFFIAHAGADIQTAEKLYDSLTRQSESRCRVFLDTRSLTLGDNWDIQLPLAQQNSRITIVLISSKTEGGYYQREEIAAAIDLARESGYHRVIPVFLDPAAQNNNVPYGLRLKHGVTISSRLTIKMLASQLLDLLSKQDELEKNPTQPLEIGKEQPAKAPLKKYIFTGLILVLVTVAGWYFFFRGKSKTESLCCDPITNVKPFIDSMGLAAWYFEKKPGASYRFSDYFSPDTAKDAELASLLLEGFIKKYSGIAIPLDPLEKNLTITRNPGDSSLVLQLSLPANSSLSGFKIELSKNFYDHSNAIISLNEESWTLNQTNTGGIEFFYTKPMKDSQVTFLLKK